MLSMNSDCNMRRKPQVTHSKTLRSESFRHIVPLIPPATCVLNTRSRTCPDHEIHVLSPSS